MEIPPGSVDGKTKPIKAKGNGWNTEYGRDRAKVKRQKEKVKRKPLSAMLFEKTKPICERLELI